MSHVAAQLSHVAAQLFHCWSYCPYSVQVWVRVKLLVALALATLLVRIQPKLCPAVGHMGRELQSLVTWFVIDYLCVFENSFSEELEPDIDLEHASVDPPRGRCAAPCDLCNRRPCMIVADHDPSYHRGQCRCAVALRGLDCTAERFRPRRPMFIDLDWQTSTPGRQAVEERSVAMTRFCQTWNKHLLLLLLSGAGGSRRWFRQC